MKTKMKWFMRTLAIVLTMALLVGAVPLHGFAADAKPPKKVYREKDFSLVTGDLPATANLPDEPKDEQEESQSLIVGEDTGLRTEDTKYFRCVDGRYLVALYNTPVHVKNSAGVWKDIDNTLSASGETLKTKDAKNPVSVPQDITAGKLQAGDGKHTIGFGVEASPAVSSASRAKVVPSPVVLNASAGSDNTASEKDADKTGLEKSVDARNAETMSLQKLVSTVVYENLFPGADLQYSITPNKVKESIIAKEKQEKYVYAFTLDLGGLIPVAQDDGSIWLLESAEDTAPTFTIEAPYMVDADMRTSYDVSMEIVDGILTVTADPAWINAPDRVFPVNIDPTINLSPNTTTFTSKSIASANQAADCSPGYFLVGHSSRGTARGFTKFPLPTIPDCGVISNAWLQTYEAGESGSALAWVNARKVTSTWTPLLMTWLISPFASSTVMDYQCFDAGKNKNDGVPSMAPLFGLHLYRWNITTAVKDYLSR